MHRIATILAATDFSEGARSAALRAGMLARELNVEKALLLHVVPRFPLGAELELRASGAVESALVRLAAELRGACGFEFGTRAESGAVTDVLSAAAREFDLVAVGARGLHPLRDLAIGSTAERLLRKIRRPMLVVKRKPAGPYRRVLVPVDFSKDSRAALALATKMAPNADLNVVHAFEVPFEATLRFAGVEETEIQRYRSERREQARAELNATLEDLGISPERAVRSISHGYAPGVIADAERELGADLLVIGKHGKSRVEELLLGSVTLHALATAQCDVLIVPPPGRAS